MGRHLAVVAGIAVSGCTGTIPLAIPGPDQLRVQAQVEEALVHWTVDARATGYVIYVAEGSVVDPLSYDSLPGGQQIPAGTPPLVLSGLTANQQYAVVVTQVISGNETQATGIARVTPLGTGLDGVPPLDTPALTLLGGQTGSEWGAALARAPSVNDDPIDDVLIGAPGFDGGELNEGASYVLLGSASGLSPTPAATVQGNRITARMGESVAGLGDLTGDGYGEVVLGLPSFDGPPVAAGQVAVHLGQTGGTNPVAAFSQTGGAMGEQHGTSVSAAGDIDGDTIPDVLVGAPGLTNPEAGEGAVFVYYGGPSGIDAGKTPLQLELDLDSGALGTSVAGVGDVDGNNEPDVLAGAPGFGDVGQAGEGVATLFLNTGGVLTPAWSFEGDSGGASLGATVAALGDVNGDGRPDVGIGAPDHSQGLASQGRYLVFFGDAGGTPLLPGLDVLGAQANGRAGRGLAGGDVTGDGIADVVVGASGDTGTGYVVLHVGASTLSPTELWRSDSTTPGNGYGTAVAIADVNGDGSGDILVGAPSHSGTQTDEGAVFVFFGPPRLGPDVSAGDPFAGTVGTLTATSNATFTDTAAGTDWTCTWTWGDGSPSTQIADCDPGNVGGAEHAYAARGRYLVRLRVENEYGLAGEAVTQALIAP